MDVDSLKKFNDELSLLLEINNYEVDKTFIYLFRNKNVVVKNSFSIADAEGCDNFIVIGRKRWKNGSYTNLMGILIGMCSNSLFWESEIWLNHKWRLVDITFSFKGGGYNKMKPTLVFKNTQNEIREFTPEHSKSWDEDFTELFKLAYKDLD